MMKLTLLSSASTVALGLIQRAGDYALAVNQEGARFRRRLVLACVAAFWLGMVVIEGAPRSSVLAWLPSPDGFAGALAEWGIWVLLSPLTMPVIRHLIPLVVGVWLAMEAGARYLDDLFELGDVPVARRYLYSAVFGAPYSAMEIKDGEVLEKHRDLPVARIGGPGYVKVHLGSVAVMERVDGEVKLYGPTDFTFIHGFERLREAVDLRDQAGVQDNVAGLTKDGIRVTAHDAKMVFRVRGDVARSPASPYPYTERAVRQLVYGTSIAADGSGSWTRALPGLIARSIRDYVAANTLDRLLENENGGGNPRQILTSSFYTPDRDAQLVSMGLDLVWVGVGTWETPDNVSKQWVNAWQAEWLNELYGDPAKQDLMRVRAQAEATGQVLRLIEKWWLEQKDRAYAAPNGTDCLGQTLTLLNDIKTDPDVARRLPDDYDRALSHLGRLISKTYG